MDYGEERFVSDHVQFGSIDWSASCHETEEEDSHSTTSTIEYAYTDGENSEEDEDEYYEDDHQGTTVEENKQVTVVSGKIITVEDIGKIIEKARQTLSEKEGDVGTETRSVSHHVSPNEWLHWLRNDEWVGSRKELDRHRRWTWIHVYAYFSKEQRYGGYGVILRNGLAKPLVASANFSKHGNCFYYQVFSGIKAGVELAEKRKLSDLHVQCNAIMVPNLFGHARLCSNKECRETRDHCKICKSCKIYLSGCCEKPVIPLVLELRCKNLVDLSYSWSTNSSEHYLAKREKKNKRHQVKKTEEKIAPGYGDEMEPDDFPQELRNIIWKEARMPHFRGIGPPTPHEDDQEDSTL